MHLVYGIKIYTPDLRGWLKHEEFFLDATNARFALKGEKNYVLTLYEVKQPVNLVALLNRANCFARYDIIEDTRGVK